MVTPISQSQGGITWLFTITEQYHVARYGALAGDYYKQHMPYGLELSDKHPPQRIDRRTFEIARRIFNRQTVSLK